MWMMFEFKTEREKEGKEEKAGKEKGTQLSMPFSSPFSDVLCRSCLIIRMEYHSMHLISAHAKHKTLSMCRIFWAISHWKTLKYTLTSNARYLNQATIPLRSRSPRNLKTFNNYWKQASSMSVKRITWYSWGNANEQELTKKGTKSSK